MSNDEIKELNKDAWQLKYPIKVIDGSLKINSDSMIKDRVYEFTWDGKPWIAIKEQDTFNYSYESDEVCFYELKFKHVVKRRH